jgi:hypothetical protein
MRFLPVQTWNNAQDLLRRFKEVEGIQSYVRERTRLVLPAILVMAFIGIACAIGVVVAFANWHSLLTLLGILLLPVTLLGSLFVQAYVFFSWIEGRALARELGHRHRPPPGAAAGWLSAKFGVDMGPFPPVPWVLAAIFLFAPLVLLAATWLPFALAVVLLGIAMPVLYAKCGG